MVVRSRARLWRRAVLARARGRWIRARALDERSAASEACAPRPVFEVALRVRDPHASIMPTHSRRASHAGDARQRANAGARHPAGLRREIARHTPVARHAIRLSAARRRIVSAPIDAGVAAAICAESARRSGASRMEVEQLPRESLENLPTGITGQGYQWTDLDGEGIAGVLAEESGAWYYKPNRGHGRFGPVQVVRTRPAGEGGRCAADRSRLGWPARARDAHAGHRRIFRSHRRWRAGRRFVRSRSFPLVDFTSANVRLTDLSGDGLADILITDDQAITWHPSLGDSGFGEAVRVRVPWDEEGGPRVLLRAGGSDGVPRRHVGRRSLGSRPRPQRRSLLLAESRPRTLRAESHDGLLAALRRGRHLRRAPARFADTDGSGPTDVVYAGRKGVKVFLNESGNG